MSLHDYKGHQITFIPSPEGSMWACQYVIRATGQTEVDGFPGRAYLHVKRPRPLRWRAPSGSSTNPIPTKTASILENVLTRSPLAGEIKDQRDFQSGGNALATSV